MKSTPYPWRIPICAAISVIGYFYLAYLSLFGLSPGGIDVENKSGYTIISGIDPQTPASAAGLAVGDRILAVNGQPIGNIVDWLAHRMNFSADEPIYIVVERQGTRIAATMTLHRNIWEELSPAERSTELIFLSSKLITLLIGLFVVFRRPRDFTSRVGGWVLVAMATVFEAFQWGLASSIRSLSVFLQWPVMLTYVSAAFRTPLLFSFFCLFPKRLIQRSWIWVLLLAGPVIATFYALYLLTKTIYVPTHLASLAPPWVLIAFGLQSFVYLIAALLVLPISYYRLETTTDRRRFRVLFFGALVGLLFYLPKVFGTALIDFSPAIAGLLDSQSLSLVCNVGFLVFPLAFAYAILRHRLFDIRVIIRRGLQYALARGFLLSIFPAVIGILVLDLVIHGEDPLFSTLRVRGWPYAAIGALASLAFWQRQNWLSSLDRRFFRDKYDAQRLFADVIEEIRRSSNIDQSAPSITSRVTQALHAEFCAFVVRNPGEDTYHILAVSPSGALNADLPASNNLIPLVRTLDTSVPITVAETGWLGRQLPQADKDFLHSARVSLIVPISLTEGRTEALLMLGAKRSEEPYSSEDIRLLENVAAAIAVLLLRRGAIMSDRAFEECPACGACYDTGTVRCAKEGSTLTLVAIPRLIGSRYRLENRLGQGGMGKVYKATDLPLDRAVALKMVREDFFSDQRALERFRRESEIVGSLSHPNVVTVYDSGIDANNRAFLVMELLEGITLRQELRSQRKSAPARTLQIFEHICAGVSAAHAKGLVHRDLKPENIFLVRSGIPEVVKITDFGIAKSLPQFSGDVNETLTGVPVGTVRYMSPEQLRAAVLSPRWDVWALSVIAFEMLCGAAPFTGSDFASVQTAILKIDFPRVASLNPDAPQRWQEFFDRMFAREQALRPESVDAFWEDLKSCLSAD